jgi:hypothetical protein
MAVKDEEERDEERDEDEDESEDEAPPDSTPEESESDEAEQSAADEEPEEKEAAETPAASIPPEPGSGRPAPLWVVPTYVAGLILVYLGQRVLQPMPTGQWVATLIGVLMVVGATLVRFLPQYRVGGERRDIEKLLAVLSVIGVVALAVYTSTTEWGIQKFGLASMEPDTQERVTGVLTIAWIAMVALAVIPMLFAEGALLPMRHAERPEARRVRAAAVGGLTLVIAAVYGALFVYSADKLDVKVDYSYFKTAGPSESTRKIAESLDEPLDVIAFFPQVNEIKTEVQGYLNELGKGIPNLRIEVQDRLLIPKRARDLKVTQDGVIVLSKGTTSEVLTIGIEDKNARPKLKTLDRDFQEKLLKIVRARRVVYLTVGHGELNDASQGDSGARGVKIVRQILQKQNYLLKDLGLSQGLASEIPDDADVVLALGPSEPFAPEEIGALKRYADRGGRLLIALDPDAVQWGEELDTPPGEAGEAGEPTPTPAPSASAAPTGSMAPKPDPKKADPKKPELAKKPDPTKPDPKKPDPKKPEAKKPDPTKPELAKKPDPAKPDPKKPPEAAKPPEPAPELPTTTKGSLAALARVVGLEFSPTVLANDKAHLARRRNDSDRTLLVSNRFSSHAAVSTLSRNSSRLAVVLFGTGSFEKAAASNDKVDFAIRSMAGTFADANKNYKEDPDEKPSTFNLAAAVTRPRTGPPLRRAKPEADKKDDKAAADKKDKKKEENSDEMRAFVLADADSLTDVVLSNVPGNQLLFADAVRWLGGEESFSGEVNTEEDVRIEHTKQKDLVWFYTTIFGAPALVLGLGLAYSRRSQRRGKGARK